MMLFILDILCYWFLLVIDYYILMYMDKESPEASWVQVQNLHFASEDVFK